MVKHTQTIRRFLPTSFLSVFDHFVGLARKGLNTCALKGEPSLINLPSLWKLVFSLFNLLQLESTKWPNTL